MRHFPKHFVLSHAVLPGAIRRLTSIGSSTNLLPEGFTFFSGFFDICEQRLLLTAALSQLDATESKRVRKRQVDYRSRNPVLDSAPAEELFLPDCYYTFHEVSTYTAPVSLSL